MTSESEREPLIKDFFDRRDVRKKRSGLNTVEEFKAWVSDGDLLPVADGSHYHGDVQYFRGQSRDTFALTSNLYRLCRAYGPVTEQPMHGVEGAILRVLRQEGLGRNMNDGELLMVCQHHGIPTRLLDVSTSPLEALYFAVEGEDGSDGRLFIIAPHQPPATGAQKPVVLAKSDTLPWKDAPRGTKRTNGDWSVTVRVVTDEPLDPRMRAQRGKFLVGGVHAYWANMTMNGVTDKELRPDITSLAIDFPINRKQQPGTVWTATGWSTSVPKEWKRELRDWLKSEYEITADTMYPPVTKVQRLATHVAHSVLQDMGL